MDSRSKAIEIISNDLVKAVGAAGLEIVDKAELISLRINANRRLNELRDEIHQNAIEHVWSDEKRTFGEIIALCHSELSEALEEYRDNSKPFTYYKCPECGAKTEVPDTICCSRKMKPEGIAIELADCIIRILDYCGMAGIDIEAAVVSKHEYNKTRPYRHGGKAL